MSTITNLCDCSSNGIPLYQPCRTIACVDTSGCFTCIDLKTTERRIQNQAFVPESQFIDVLGTMTIAQDYLDLSANDPVSGLSRPASSTWSTKFNLRNQSDRRVPHGYNMMTHNIVPTRGNSVKSTITANRPGAMTPGGYGVDVKHGSYARYLGKLKGQNMALGSNNGKANSIPQKNKWGIPNVTNNKSYRFTLVNSKNCLCAGDAISVKP